jgi:hypothetical protein
MNSNTATAEIRWSAIISLLALDLAILISWFAYHGYQGELLTRFGVMDHAFSLTVLQGLILFVTPPLAGLAADRLMRGGGSRVTVVNIGINFVSMVFMVVAVTITVQQPSAFLKMIFPIMVVLWLISMNIFHSPAISSIETFVPESKLPIVIAIFAILADLIAATDPILKDLIEEISAPVVFAAGGALVFLTGLWFSRAAKKLQIQGAEAQRKPDADRKSNLLMVFLLGLVVGAATTCFFKYFPLWLDSGHTGAAALVGLKPEVFTSILIAIAAVLTFPMGLLAAKIGTAKLARAAAVVCTAIIAGLLYTKGTPALILFFLYPIGFAAATVSFLPIAFTKLEKRHLVFGIGVFFAGVELLSSVVDVVNVWIATHPG